MALYGNVPEIQYISSKVPVGNNNREGPCVYRDSTSTLHHPCVDYGYLVP